jgi:hypothetical protein
MNFLLSLMFFLISGAMGVMIGPNSGAPLLYFHLVIPQISTT